MYHSAPFLFQNLSAEKQCNFLIKILHLKKRRKKLQKILHTTLCKRRSEHSLLCILHLVIKLHKILQDKSDKKCLFLSYKMLMQLYNSSFLDIQVKEIIKVIEIQNYLLRKLKK